ncbi:MAG TPA: hypothetical protein VE869_05485 [Gemmatimonas sp.]|nr:hypothetical protein [Gemmatimonas sp.]
MIKGEFLLRCITPVQAAQLIRPVLDRPGNRVVASEAGSPGVLSVEATQEQLQRVQAVLDQHDKSLTGVCVSGRTNG